MRFESLLASSCALAGVVSAQVTVYMINHAETNATGLSAAGASRAQCLVNVFSYTAPLYTTLGYIIAQPASSNGTQPSIDTITPLASSLGVPIDTSCADDDDAGSCIASLIAEKNDDLDGGYYGDILVAWDSVVFSSVVAQLDYEYGGVVWSDPPVFPAGYDTIWEDAYQSNGGYDQIDTLSENCTA